MTQLSRGASVRAARTGNGGPNRLGDRREVEGGLGGQAHVVDRVAPHIHAPERGMRALPWIVRRGGWCGRRGLLARRRLGRLQNRAAWRHLHGGDAPCVQHHEPVTMSAPKDRVNLSRSTYSANCGRSGRSLERQGCKLHASARCLSVIVRMTPRGDRPAASPFMTSGLGGHACGAPGELP
jgi:hypothetical protein